MGVMGSMGSIERLCDSFIWTQYGIQWVFTLWFLRRISFLVIGGFIKRTIRGVNVYSLLIA